MIIIQGLRYFASTIEEIEELTIDEYNIYLKASQLKKLDRTKELIENAFIQRAMKSTKDKKGTIPTIKKEIDLIDAKAIEDKILFGEKIEQQKYNELFIIAENLKEYNQLKKQKVNGG